MNPALRTDGLQLTTIRRELLFILADISGIAAFKPRDDRPVEEEPFMAPDPETGCNVIMRLMNVRTIGRDELREDWDPTLTFPNDAMSGGFTRMVCGLRVLTFSIAVETWDLTQIPAHEHSERMVSAFARPSIQDRLEEKALVSLSSIGARRNGDYFSKKFNRMMSRAGFDLVLNAVSNIDDDPVTTIESFEPPEVTVED